LVRERHDGIDAVQLVEVDALEVKPTQVPSHGVAGELSREGSLEPPRRRHNSVLPALATSAARRLRFCAYMKRAGFTLIELLTVVAIIGLVAVIAIPKLTSVKARARVAAMKSDLRNLVTLEESYFAQNLKYAAELGTAYTVSTGNAIPIITLTSDGWTATMTSPSSGQICVVFMGSTPVHPAIKEGAPACVTSGSVTVTQ